MNTRPQLAVIVKGHYGIFGGGGLRPFFTVCHSSMCYANIEFRQFRKFLNQGWTIRENETYCMKHSTK